MEKTATNKADKICTLCGTSFDEWGNNAMPIKEGICCHWCNENAVIPTRIKLALTERIKTDDY